MRIKRKDKQNKAASDQKTVARVTDEMMRPRFAKSAQLAVDEQSKKRVANHQKPHVARPAKTHMERYGTGTPPPENQS
jgi:hypothetical protein